MPLEVVIEGVDRLRAELLAMTRDRAVAPTEQAVTAVMAQHFEAEWRTLLGKFTRLRRLFPAAEAMDAGEVRRLIALLASVQAPAATRTAKRLVEKLTPAFIAGHRAAAHQVTLAASFDVPQPRAVAWLKGHCAELVKGIDETTRGRVASIVTQAVEEGWSYTRTEGELKRLYDGFRVTKPQLHILSRARLIAVNEAAVAYGQGQQDMRRWMTSQGLALEKSWMTVGGDRVCEICAGNEGDGWIPTGDGFSSGAECEPQHPACRCVTLTRLAREEAAA